MDRILQTNKQAKIFKKWKTKHTLPLVYKEIRIFPFQTKGFPLHEQN